MGGEAACVGAQRCCALLRPYGMGAGASIQSAPMTVDAPGEILIMMRRGWRF